MQWRLRRDFLDDTKEIVNDALNGKFPPKNPTDVLASGESVSIEGWIDIG